MSAQAVPAPSLALRQRGFSLHASSGAVAESFARQRFQRLAKFLLAFPPVLANIARWQAFSFHHHLQSLVNLDVESLACGLLRFGIFFGFLFLLGFAFACDRQD